MPGLLPKVRHFRPDVFLCAIILVFLSVRAAPGAGPAGGGDQDYSVQWIGEISERTLSAGQRALTGRLLKLILGRKSPSLVRPVAFLASGATWFILDQGLHAVIVTDSTQQRYQLVRSRQYDRFPSLVSACVAADGTLYFTDSRLNAVFVLRKGEKKARKLPVSRQLERPTGIAWSPVFDEIWVTETLAHRIAVLDRKGNVKRTIGHRGKGRGEFNFPNFLWIDRSGLAYVVDALNFRVQVIGPDGAVVTSFGEVGDASGYLARPKGVATDRHGNVYLVDALFNAVQIFDRGGRLLYRFGSPGHEKGEFWLPTGIFVDERDRIYVADTYNGRVQIFELRRGAHAQN